MELKQISQHEKSTPSIEGHLFVTIRAEFTVNGTRVIVKMTQRYNPKYEHGHYWAVVESMEGHILAARAPSGGVHDGRITIKDCADFLQTSL